MVITSRSSISGSSDRGSKASHLALSSDNVSFGGMVLRLILGTSCCLLYYTSVLQHRKIQRCRQQIEALENEEDEDYDEDYDEDTKKKNIMMKEEGVGSSGVNNSSTKSQCDRSLDKNQKTHKGDCHCYCY